MSASTSSASSSSSPISPISPIQRCKDAEGILVKGVKRHLVRQISAPELGRGKELPSLAKKTCAIWECIELRPNGIGGSGYIEVFKLKCSPDDEATQRQMGIVEQYPAIEMSSTSIRDRIYSKQTMEQILSGKHREESTLKFYLGKLGVIYREDETGFYVEKPDCHAFNANWERLRQEYPQLPPLDVIPDSGIASDLDYFHTLLARDGLMSEGKESFHDLYHLIQWVELVLAEGLNYKNKKFQIATIFVREYRRIMIAERVINEEILPISNKTLLEFKQNLKKLEANLGAFADSFLDEIRNSITSITINSPSHFSSYYEVNRWKTYWQTKRQDLGDFDFTLLCNLWKITIKITNEFDKIKSGKTIFESGGDLTYFSPENYGLFLSEAVRFLRADAMKYDVPTEHFFTLANLYRTIMEKTLFPLLELEITRRNAPITEIHFLEEIYKKLPSNEKLLLEFLSHRFFINPYESTSPEFKYLFPAVHNAILYKYEIMPTERKKILHDHIYRLALMSEGSVERLELADPNDLESRERLGEHLAKKNLLRLALAIAEIEKDEVADHSSTMFDHFKAFEEFSRLPIEVYTTQISRKKNSLTNTDLTNAIFSASIRHGYKRIVSQMLLYKLKPKTTNNISQSNYLDLRSGCVKGSNNIVDLVFFKSESKTYTVPSEYHSTLALLYKTLMDHSAPAYLVSVPLTLQEIYNSLPLADKKLIDYHIGVLSGKLDSGEKHVFDCYLMFHSAVHNAIISKYEDISKIEGQKRAIDENIYALAQSAGDVDERKVSDQLAWGAAHAMDNVMRLALAIATLEGPKPTTDITKHLEFKQLKLDIAKHTVPLENIYSLAHLYEVFMSQSSDLDTLASPEDFRIIYNSLSDKDRTLINYHIWVQAGKPLGEDDYGAKHAFDSPANFYLAIHNAIISKYKDMSKIEGQKRAIDEKIYTLAQSTGDVNESEVSDQLAWGAAHAVENVMRLGLAMATVEGPRFSASGATSSTMM